MESVSPPEWLTRSKQALLKSQEWQEFQDQLTAAVDHHLTEVPLDNFRDLSEEAKRSLLQNALQSVHQGESYARISGRVSEIVAEHIHLNRKYHVDSMRTPEWASLQTQADAGLLHLLQKWPDLKSKLYRCFNMQLPQSLRRLVWSLYLENPQVKTNYLEKFRQNPESTMSLLDLEIVKNCDHLLQTEETLQPLKTFAKSLHLMKAVLSYYHVTLQTSSSIIASDYMLALPFVYVTLATNPSTSLTVADTATTIEQFMTFMECRPVYMKESYTTEFEAVWTEFTDKVISRLKAADEDLLGHVKAILDKDSPARPAESFAEKMKSVIRPMVRSMFVGYLSLDSVLFVWDQYLIGLDAPNYDIIPVITALTISLLRLQVLQCQTAEEISSCLKRDGNKLKKEFYMYEINRNFYQDLNTSLNSRPALDSKNYPMPWNVNVPAQDVDSPVNRENIRLRDLLEKESRKRQEIEERYTTGMKEMKEELNQLRKLIEKEEDAKNENDNLHQPSTSYSGK